MKKLLLFTAMLLSTYLFADSPPPFSLPNKSGIKKINSALIKTSKGDLIVKLFPEIAPWHVSNFKFLADTNFYDGLSFHIFEKGYVIQTGAPNREINSGPGYSIPPEFSQKKFSKGSLVMVRKPNDLDLEHTRNSHGSQFRILLKNVYSMEGRHTIFGKVVSGFDVLEKLRKGDLIEDLIVYVK